LKKDDDVTWLKLLWSVEGTKLTTLDLHLNREFGWVKCQPRRITQKLREEQCPICWHARSLGRELFLAIFSSENNRFLTTIILDF
jgi:hypothetical protein